MSIFKDINWNSLSISIPGSWETIVKNPRHLIFEHELSPCLEIRWQQPGKPPSRRHTESLVKQFGHQDVRADGPRPPTLGIPDALTRQFECTVLNGNNNEMVLLLLVCRKCQMTILVGLHHMSSQQSADYASILASLRCHGDDETAGNWRIHDLFFFVPNGFELDSSAFQFGASNLLFKARKSELRFIRMAPASQHLKQNDLRALFASFCTASPETIQLVDQTTLRYHSSPSLMRRFWLRLKRTRPYTRASFSHFSDSDRIVGWLLSTSRRPSPEQITELENGYGIIQEKAYTAGADA